MPKIRNPFKRNKRMLPNGKEGKKIPRTYWLILAIVIIITAVVSVLLLINLGYSIGEIFFYATIYTFLVTSIGWAIIEIYSAIITIVIRKVNKCLFLFVK